MKTEKLIAKFTNFPKDDNFVSGDIGDFQFQAKLFDGGSPFGIKGGRVSKLSIWEKNRSLLIINYDRGWDKKPTTANRSIFNAVMELCENSPKRFENEAVTQNFTE